VVEEILNVEFLDLYLKSIAIDTVGKLVEATTDELEKASRPPVTAGTPDIMISSMDVDEIIAFQHYVKFNSYHPNSSKIIKDFSSITEEPFLAFKIKGMFDYTTRSFSDWGKWNWITFGKH
jgi:hypothetical protein